MKQSALRIGSDGNDRLVITEVDTGKEYVFYTPEAAWAFFRACNENRIKVKHNES